MTIPEDLVSRIQRAAFRHGEFHLPTGQILEEYFDEYVLAADPDVLRQVAEAMAGVLPSSTEVLVGLELGGIALTCVLDRGLDGRSRLAGTGIDLRCLLVAAP